MHKVSQLVLICLIVIFIIYKYLCKNIPIVINLLDVPLYMSVGMLICLSTSTSGFYTELSIEKYPFLLNFLQCKLTGMTLT